MDSRLMDLILIMSLVLPTAACALVWGYARGLNILVPLGLAYCIAALSFRSRSLAYIAAIALFSYLMLSAMLS